MVRPSCRDRCGQWWLLQLVVVKDAIGSLSFPALSGSREDAEDLVQEAFAQVLRRPRLLRSNNDVGYLLRALRNAYFDSRRTAARRPSTEELPDEHGLIDCRQDDPADRIARHDALFGAIAGLSQHYRDALVAVDIVGLSYREAARALRTREETLATRLFRARQRVAHHITDDAPNPPPNPDGKPNHVQGRASPALAAGVKAKP